MHANFFYLQDTFITYVFLKFKQQFDLLAGICSQVLAIIFYAPESMVYCTFSIYV